MDAEVAEVNLRDPRKTSAKPRLRKYITGTEYEKLQLKQHQDPPMSGLPQRIYDCNFRRLPRPLISNDILAEVLRKSSAEVPPPEPPPISREGAGWRLGDRHLPTGDTTAGRLT